MIRCMPVTTKFTDIRNPAAATSTSAMISTRRCIDTGGRVASCSMARNARARMAFSTALVSDAGLATAAGCSDTEFMHDTMTLPDFAGNHSAGDGRGWY